MNPQIPARARAQRGSRAIGCDRRIGGFVLLPVVLALVLLAALASVLNRQGPAGQLAISQQVDTTAAQYAAQAGLHHGLYLIEAQNCAAPTDLSAAVLGDDRYDVTFSANGLGSVAATTFSASADTSLKQNQAAVNFGGAAALEVQPGSGVESRALLRFDLSSIASETRIVAAALQVYVIDPDANVSPLLYRVTSDWAEMTATWDSHNDKFWPTATASVSRADAGGVYDNIDVTELVQSWVNGAAPNYGLLISAGTTGEASQYASRNQGSGAQQPKLVVRTTTGTPATAVDLTAHGASAAGANAKISRRDLPLLRSPSHSITVQLTADAIDDAYITGSKPDWNYGGPDFIRSDEGAGPQRGMLRFNLDGRVPVGATVTRARLHLHANTMVGTVDIYGLTRGWSEGACSGDCTPSAVTWNNYDGTNAWTTAGGDVDSQPTTSLAPAAQAAWYEFDITTLAAAWASGARANYGVQLRSSGGLGLFASGDHSVASWRPRVTLEYRCTCGTVCLPPSGSGALLLVVSDASNPVTSDTELAARLSAWGYSVNLIADDDTPANFASALAANDVVYVSASVSAASIAAKLTEATLGIVTEKNDLNDELGIASSSAAPVGKVIYVTDVANDIVGSFASGPLTIFNQAIAGLRVAGTAAAGLETLATWNGAGAVVRLDAGAAESSGGSYVGDGTASGRRVMLPLGSDATASWTALNSNGQLLVNRAIEWARAGSTCFAQSAAVRISASSDDAEEDRATTVGEMSLDSSDVELVTDASAAGVQLVGLRFARLPIPRGASITDAYIDFTVDKVDSVATSVTFAGEAEDSAGTFLDVDSNISSRSLTTATTAWNNIETWDALGQVKTSPDLGPIVQEIVARPGWRANNAAAFIVAGSGQRTAYAFDGDSAAAPLLRVNFCGDMVEVVKVLMVVVDSANLTAQESAKKALIESWGYAVNLIAESENQTAYDTATAANAVVFIGEDVNSANVGTKLTAAAIGVVNEDGNLVDEFGLAATVGITSNPSLSVQDNTHYITLPFAGGMLDIFAVDEQLVDLHSPLAPSLDVLASNSNGPALVALDKGAMLIAGDLAAGRRAYLPWGGDSMDSASLNDNGRTIFRRALEWAAGANTAAVENGPVAHWALDEASGTLAIDDEGGHDGTLNGGVWAAGKIAGGLALNGSANHLQVADDNALDLAQGFTLMGWINKDTLSGNDIIFAKGDGSDRENYWLGTSGDEIGFGFYNGGSIDFATTAVNLAAGAWYHVAATFDNAADTARIYLNGVEVFSGTSAVDPLINADPLYIGRSQYGEYFDGALDDLRIFNYALPQSEVAAIEALGHAVIYAGMSEAALGSNGTSLTITQPGGSAVGDLLVAVVATDGSTAADLSPPAGWTPVDVGEESSNVTLGVWWKNIDGTEAPNIAFKWGGTEQAYGTLMRFTGHDPKNPINASASNAGRSSAPTSVSVTTSVANALILQIGGFDDDDIIVDDSGLDGYTTITMDRSSTGSGTVSAGVGYATQPVAGNSATAKFSLTAAEEYRVVTIAITPR